MFPKHDLYHRPTFIKHIRMGNFEFYVKFYDNFSNNIICSEHLTVVTSFNIFQYQLLYGFNIPKKMLYLMNKSL